MNCEIVHRRLLSLERPESPPADLLDHLAVCGACRSWHEHLVSLEHEVPFLPVPAPERRASLSVSRQGSSFSIDLTVDSAWLHDSRRHFPVLVDPTLTVQPDTQDADFTWNINEWTYN